MIQRLLSHRPHSTPDVGLPVPDVINNRISAVDDLDKACKRFSDLGVKFKKRPEDGKMRNIAFL
jgi:hypothetical protein